MASSLLNNTYNRRLLGFLFSLGLLLFSLVSAIALYAFQQFEDYPDGFSGGVSTIVGSTPLPEFRRETSYFSNDSQAQVLQWYTDKLGLEIQTGEQGSCRVAAKTIKAPFVITYEVNVTICETEVGQLVVATRALDLHLP